MIWVFGLVVGLLYKLPTAYWVIGFLAALVDSHCKQVENEKAYNLGRMFG